MYNQNLINIDDLHLDTPIYRIISYDYFIEALLHSELTLVKPHLWDDPFEEFLAKQDFRGPNDENYTMKYFANDFFGQCWSLDYESDFMWRVYSMNYRGLKIKSTIKSVIGELKKEITEGDLLKIGKVKYWDDQKIKMYFEDSSFLGNLLVNGFYHSLLIKKESFKHENEIRIIYYSQKEGVKKEDILKIKINTNNLFHEIALHPRLPKPLRSGIEKTIRKLGYKNEIIYSNLYSVPELNIKFNWGK